MQHRVLIIILMCCFSGCGEKPNGPQELLEADRAMSALAGRLGFYGSILATADSQLVKLEEGKLALVGLARLAESYSKERDPKTISWSPRWAEVSASGELGYSWGDWEFKLPDTTYYGNYVTIWRKNEKGVWKVVLDGGNNTPKP